MDKLEVTNLSENIDSFTSNVFLIDLDETILIDAGNDERIIRKLTKKAFDIDKLLITHFHPDHIGLAKTIKEEFEVEILAHKKEKDWVDKEIGSQEEISVGESKISALYTPGHHPSHLVFLIENSLFSGDLIFPGGSYGRTDLPGGNLSELTDSIEKVLEKFGDKLQNLYPGHMDPIHGKAKEHIKKSLKLSKNQM